MDSVKPANGKKKWYLKAVKYNICLYVLAMSLFKNDFFRDHFDRTHPFFKNRLIQILMQKVVIDIVLVSLLLTLNRFHI